MKIRKQATWQLQTAKSQFSQLVRRALAEGPQYVTRQGKDAVVVVPTEEFEGMSAYLTSMMPPPAPTGAI